MHNSPLEPLTALKLRHIRLSLITMTKRDLIKKFTPLFFLPSSFLASNSEIYLPFCITFISDYLLHARVELDVLVHGEMRGVRFDVFLELGLR